MAAELYSGTYNNSVFHRPSNIWLHNIDNLRELLDMMHCNPKLVVPQRHLYLWIGQISILVNQNIGQPKRCVVFIYQVGTDTPV